MTEQNSIPLLLDEILKGTIDSYNALFEKLDIKHFNAKFDLQEYQIAGLKQCICALKMYQNDAVSLCKMYEHGISTCKVKQDTKSLDIKEFCNMASIWMATGSGKSIVMIKLISLMQKLMKNGEIESKPIMLLAPNDKILKQFREHIESFNKHMGDITYKNMRDYESGGLYDLSECIFIGRSDLLDTKENVGRDTKAKRIDYKNLIHEKGWYILLDEAHRGDSKDSTRKRYIRELARGLCGKDEYPRGFIFNFSATFDNDIDFFTCAFNYNLQKFNRDGYGKHIVVLDSNMKAFKDSTDDEAKIDNILESFVLFVAIKQELRALKEKFHNLHYHHPLIISVSDKVHTRNAGIKLYFEAILKILKDSKDVSNIAQGLIDRLQSDSIFFEERRVNENLINRIKHIQTHTVREEIFYASQPSTLEYCKVKDNAKELVFKSKNARLPFLLLHIGSTREWEKCYLDTLDIDNGADMQTSYFENINEYSSPIQIMMGSKVFSEGWDSNRVNLINFINIGSKSAKKYVLQTIGRGVRIEPFKDVRKRLKKIEELDYHKKDSIGDGTLGIESVFIMATDNEAIKGILKGINSFRVHGELKGFQRNNTPTTLIVPRYKNCGPIDKPFAISKCDFDALSKYIQSFDEDVLLLSNGIDSKDLGFSTLIKIQEKQLLKIRGDERELEIHSALRKIDAFFHTHLQEVDGFVECDEKTITHFNNFVVSTSRLSDKVVEEMNARIKEVLKAGTAKSNDALLQEYENQIITRNEYLAQVQANQNLQPTIHYEGYTFSDVLKKHYYSPMILKTESKNSESKNQDINITHAIREKSEIEFIKDLEKYVRDPDKPKRYHWCFSRIAEKEDSIYIPYFDSMTHSLRQFYPDFIFWLKDINNESYRIVFIDPKGLGIESNTRDKLESFERLFKNKTFSFEDLREIKVDLFLYNKASKIPNNFEKYVAASIDSIFNIDSM